MSSPWLTPDGRKAAELIGKPRRWEKYSKRMEFFGDDPDLSAEVNIEYGEYWRMYYLNMNVEPPDCEIGLPSELGQAIQNDHARRRLAEKGVQVERCLDSKYRVYKHIATNTEGCCSLYGFLSKGQFVDPLEVGEEMAYDVFDSYEAASIAGTIAVYGDKK